MLLCVCHAIETLIVDGLHTTNGRGVMTLTTTVADANIDITNITLTTPYAFTAVAPASIPGYYTLSAPGAASTYI